MLLVRDHLLSARVAIDKKTLSPDLLAVDITHPVSTSSVRIVCIYRPPNTTASQSALLLDHCANLATIPHHLVFIGDLNCNIQWDNPGDLSGFHSSLFHLAESLSLSQVVPHPTRGSNFLDIMLASDDLVSTCTVGAPFSSSDHSSFTFSFDFSTAQSNFIPKLCFSRTDYDTLSYLIGSLDWFSHLDNCNDIDMMYDRFVSLVSDRLAKCTPISRLRLSFDKYPPHIRNLHRHKELLFAKLHLDGVLPQFKITCAKLESEIRAFLRSRENATFSKPLTSNTRFYSYVGSRIKTKAKNVSLLGPLGTPLISNSDKCELLADYFSTVFTIDDGSLPSLSLPRIDSSCPLPLILPHEVAKNLRKIKPSCCLPIDKLPPIIFKKCSEALSIPLSIIFNFSISLGTVPRIWKSSIVVPIPKSASPSSPSDYRPISLTPTASKTLERIIKGQLVDWCTKHNLIPTHQHGFVSSRSVTSQLLEVTQGWREALDVGFAVDAVYIDLAKAFDTVSFPKLLHKLESLGIRGQLYDWLSSFLNERSFQVRVGDSLSFPRPVLSGVPQGSVLGPFLFLLYVSDIGSIVSTAPLVDLRLFADDLKIYSSFDPSDPSTSHTQLENCLNSLVVYCHTWQLRVATQKCSVLHIGTTNPCLPFTLDTVVLPKVDCIRDLGVLVDTKLTFSQHIDRLAVRSTSLVFSLFRTLSSTLPTVYLQCYKSYVLPILDFASPVWSPHSKKHIAKIEAVQSLFTRMLVRRCSNRLSVFSPYESRLTECNLITLFHRRILTDILTAVKIIRKDIDVPASSFFIFRPTGGRTNHYGLVVRKSRKLMLRNSFSYRSVTYLLKVNSLIAKDFSIPTLKAHIPMALETL